MNDLEADSTRVDLGRRAIASMDAWGVARSRQRRVLALSADEWARVQRSAPLPLQWEVIERAGLVCACPGPGTGAEPPWSLLDGETADIEGFQGWLDARTSQTDRNEEYP